MISLNKQVQPRKRRKSRWLGGSPAGFIFFAAFLAGGCATTPQDRGGAETDPLAPSPHEVIGHVALVDPANDLAVINLESHVRQISGQLRSRNEILLETATLEPTDQRTRRSLGVRIVEGLPNVGDEVIIARD